VRAPRTLAIPRRQLSRSRKRRHGRIWRRSASPQLETHAPKAAGFIALRSGIATGAEAVLIPETVTYINELITLLERSWERKKSSAIVIVAEGDDAGGAYQVADKVKEKFNRYDIRVTVLGHLQRGGSPSALDRVLGSRMGNSAVNALLAGRTDEMVGIVNHEVRFTPFQNATKHHNDISPYLLELIAS